MAANLLRVVRGAGRPYELPQQIINLAGEILEVSKTARAWAVSSAMQEALHSAISDWEADEEDYYEGRIACGGMQWVASRLVGQRAQECAGSREMSEAFEQRERWAERQRKKYWEEEARVRAEILEVQRQKRIKTRAAKPKAPKPSPAPTKAEDDPIDKPRSTAEFMRARRKGFPAD
jgi:hypothetical protein